MQLKRASERVNKSVRIEKDCMYSFVFFEISLSILLYCECSSFGYGKSVERDTKKESWWRKRGHCSVVFTV